MNCHILSVIKANTVKIIVALTDVPELSDISEVGVDGVLFWLSSLLPFVLSFARNFCPAAPLQEEVEHVVDSI